MPENCICYKNYYYSGEEALRFYKGQEWKDYNTAYGKIIECPSCQTLWNYKYDKERDHLIIEKKFRRPELLLYKFVSLTIEKGGDKKDFYNNKIIKVFNDDKSIVIELSWDWFYEGKKLRYFLVNSNYPGYLSDLYTIGIDSIEVNIAYSSKNDLIVSDSTKEDFIFTWQGTIKKK